MHSSLFIRNRSSPHDILLLWIMTITVEASVIVRKVTTRNMSIFIDRWYMACSRVIMMTWTTFQSVYITKNWSWISSPPSMAFMTINVRHCMKPTIAPKKTTTDEPRRTKSTKETHSCNSCYIGPTNWLRLTPTIRVQLLGCEGTTPVHGTHFICERDWR